MCYDRSYDRNPNKLDHFDHKNFSIFELNDLAFLDYDRNAVIVLATGLVRLLQQKKYWQLELLKIKPLDHKELDSCRLSLIFHLISSKRNNNSNNTTQQQQI